MSSPHDFVKGGTTTAAHDQMVARQHADAERRRALSDLQHQAVREVPETVKLYTHKLGSHQRDPVVVLKAEYQDKSLMDYIVCEISSQGPDELALTMVCMNCVRKLNRKVADSQLTIRSKHREFTLDMRTKEQGGQAMELWVNPHPPGEVYTLAGEITTHGKITCPALGCYFRFVIDKNVIRSA